MNRIHQDICIAYIRAVSMGERLSLRVGAKAKLRTGVLARHDSVCNARCVAYCFFAGIIEILF